MKKRRKRGNSFWGRVYDEVDYIKESHTQHEPQNILFLIMVGIIDTIETLFF